MEGGKMMKFKNTVKTIFITYLCLLAICLYVMSFISYTRKPLSSLSASLSNQINESEPLDYRILDKNDYTNYY